MAVQKTLRDQALALNPVDRATLIDDLLSSFDSGGREAIDRAWAVEAEDRIAAYKRGEIGSIGLEESRRRTGAK